MVLFFNEESDDFHSLEEINENENSFVFRGIKTDHFILKKTKEFITKFKNIEYFTWNCDIPCPEELLKYVWTNKNLKTFKVKALDFQLDFFKNFPEKLHQLHLINISDPNRKDLLNLIKTYENLKHFILEDCEIENYEEFCLAFEDRPNLLKELTLIDVKLKGTQYPRCRIIHLEIMNYPDMKFSSETRELYAIGITKYQMKNILLNKDTHAPTSFDLFIYDSKEIDDILSVFIQSFKQTKSLTILPLLNESQRITIKAIESGYYKELNTVRQLEMIKITENQRVPNTVVKEVVSMLGVKPKPKTNSFGG